MIESEISLAKSAPGFKGEVNDDLYRQVIASYSKKMDKARAEYLDLGPRGEEMARKLGWEVEYLSRWLPTKLDQRRHRGSGSGDHRRARRCRRPQSGRPSDRSDHEGPQGRGRWRPCQQTGGGGSEPSVSASLKARATFTNSTTGTGPSSVRGTICLHGAATHLVNRGSGGRTR